MERKVLKKNGRDKKFIGAIIGAAASVAGGLISDNKKRKAENRAFRAEQAEQNRLDGVKQANAMSAVYSNQGYVDDYQNKVVLQNGGKVKAKQIKSTDRVNRAKKFAIGGRKKAGLGSLVGEGGIGEEAGNAAGGLAGLASALLSKPSTPKVVKKADGFKFGQPKTALATNSYDNQAILNTPVDINNGVVPTLNNTISNGLVNPLLNPNQLAKYGKRISKRSRESGL